MSGAVLAMPQAARADQAFAFGAPGDYPVSGTYATPGRSHAAVYRPSEAKWYVRDVAPSGIAYGVPNWVPGYDDEPAQADYDGDGADDLAIFRHATGTWYSPALPGAVRFGGPDDVPVPGNYVGSSAAEPAVWRPTTGWWYWAGNPGGMPWGVPCTASAAAGGLVCDDIPVPGDYDGDGHVEPAVYRMSQGRWYTRAHPEGVAFGVPCRPGDALGCDVPVPGDYFGTGRTSFGVYRPATGMFYSQAKPAGIVSGISCRPRSAPVLRGRNLVMAGADDCGLIAVSAGHWTGAAAAAPGFFDIFGSGVWLLKS